MKIKKFFLAAFGLLGGSLSALADSTPGDLDPAVSTAVSTMETAAKNVVSAVAGPLVNILVAVLTISIIWFVYRAVRRTLGR